MIKQMKLFTHFWILSSCRYQTGLKESMKSGDFVFDCINLLRYKCHKINLECDRPYIDSPVWMKNKKPTNSPISDDDKWFQYAAAVALNHEQNVKNNPTIALNVFYVKKMNIYPAYISKHPKSWKRNHSFNDFKRRRIALSYSKKVICIVKTNSLETCLWLFLFELSSFV